MNSKSSWPPFENLREFAKLLRPDILLVAHHDRVGYVVDHVSQGPWSAGGRDLDHRERDTARENGVPLAQRADLLSQLCLTTLLASGGKVC